MVKRRGLGRRIPSMGPWGPASQSSARAEIVRNGPIQRDSALGWPPWDVPPPYVTVDAETLHDLEERAMAEGSDLSVVAAAALRNGARAA